MLKREKMAGSENNYFANYFISFCIIIVETKESEGKIVRKAVKTNWLEFSGCCHVANPS